jgi:hypothetical protein
VTTIQSSMNQRGGPVEVGVVFEHLEIVESVGAPRLFLEELVAVCDEQGTEGGECGRRCDEVLREEKPRVPMIEGDLLDLLHQVGRMPHLGGHDAPPSWAYGVRSLWHDGQRQRLEGCLADFIAHLSVMAGAIKTQREEMQRAVQERHEADARRWEEERVRREEEERVRRFEEMLGRWRLARDVREYVAEVREVIAAANGAIPEGIQLEESLKWAEAFARRIDPVARIREDIAHVGVLSDEVVLEIT